MAGRADGIHTYRLPFLAPVELEHDFVAAPSGRAHIGAGGDQLGAGFLRDLAAHFGRFAQARLDRDGAGRRGERQEVDPIVSEATRTEPGGLGEEQREVFVAHELEGRSFKEMAAETGVSVNTLLSRKHYAVLHLRRRLRTIYDEFKEK